MPHIRGRNLSGAIAVFIVAILFFCPSRSYGGTPVNVVKLPPPKKGDTGLEEAIEERRSRRSFEHTPLTEQEISNLLWACQGITDKETGFRSAPSAGATYPLEIFIATAAGLFHYIPSGHAIEILGKKDVRGDLAAASLGQAFIKEAPVDIIICADFERTTRRYGRRGVNYVYIEVGHAAQNIHLEAVAMGLVSVPVGAFSDEAVSDVLGLSPETVPIYIIPVGHYKR